MLCFSFTSNESPISVIRINDNLDEKPFSSIASTWANMKARMIGLSYRISFIRIFLWTTIATWHANFKQSFVLDACKWKNKKENMKMKSCRRFWELNICSYLIFLSIRLKHEMGHTKECICRLPRIKMENNLLRRIIYSAHCIRNQNMK